MTFLSKFRNQSKITFWQKLRGKTIYEIHFLRALLRHFQGSKGSPKHQSSPEKSDQTWLTLKSTIPVKNKWSLYGGFHSHGATPIARFDGFFQTSQSKMDDWEVPPWLMKPPIPRCEPWCWYIYLQNWVILFGQMLVCIFQHHGSLISVIHIMVIIVLIVIIVRIVGIIIH